MCRELSASKNSRDQCYKISAAVIYSHFKVIPSFCVIKQCYSRNKWQWNASKLLSCFYNKEGEYLNTAISNWYFIRPWKVGIVVKYHSIFIALGPGADVIKNSIAVMCFNVQQTRLSFTAPLAQYNNMKGT